MEIENFIHSAVLSVKINLQSLQHQWLSKVFGNFIKSDKETLFHSSWGQGVRAKV